MSQTESLYEELSPEMLEKQANLDIPELKNFYYNEGVPFKTIGEINEIEIDFYLTLSLEQLKRIAEIKNIQFNKFITRDEILNLILNSM